MGNIISPETMAILECLAEGYKPGAVSDLLSVPISKVYNAKRNHPDVISELQGKKPDGSPARFAPGCGAETIAKMERVEERGTGNPSPTEETGENRKHSIAELFQEIEALKKENTVLNQELAEFAKRFNEAREEIEKEKCKAKEDSITIYDSDFIEGLEIVLKNLAISPETNLEHLRGYISCFLHLRYFDNKRKEKAKNARPEED